MWFLPTCKMVHFLKRHTYQHIGAFWWYRTVTLECQYTHILSPYKNIQLHSIHLYWEIELQPETTLNFPHFPSVLWSVLYLNGWKFPGGVSGRDTNWVNYHLSVSPARRGQHSAKENIPHSSLKLRLQRRTIRKEKCQSFPIILPVLDSANIILHCALYYYITTYGMLRLVQLSDSWILIKSPSRRTR
jgi:hypothetical protein